MEYVDHRIEFGCLIGRVDLQRRDKVVPDCRVGKVAIGGGREFTAYKDLKECRV